MKILKERRIFFEDEQVSKEKWEGSNNEKRKGEKDVTHNCLPEIFTNL
jgi:hypothetical protein